uniref:DNA_ligase_aden domain-containing protein n=1 Tax=Steinernema glaseri TaxID=37863 RepID=A0A1I7ZML7_9BILA
MELYARSHKMDVCKYLESSFALGHKSALSRDSAWVKPEKGFVAGLTGPLGSHTELGVLRCTLGVSKETTTAEESTPETATHPSIVNY